MQSLSRRSINTLGRVLSKLPGSRAKPESRLIVRWHFRQSIRAFWIRHA